jgi:hypothetical protein
MFSESDLCFVLGVGLTHGRGCGSLKSLGRGLAFVWLVLSLLGLGLLGVGFLAIVSGGLFLVVLEGGLWLGWVKIFSCVWGVFVLLGWSWFGG